MTTTKTTKKTEWQVEKLPPNPFMSEILEVVHKQRSKAKKIEVLKHYRDDALTALLIWNFDPSVVSALPDGDVPYKPNDVPEGTEHTRLNQEYRQLWHYIKGADAKTPQFRKEQMFVQLLEGLHVDEAKVICYAKDKVLHQKYKGLSDNVVKEAFGWNENYVKAT